MGYRILLIDNNQVTARAIENLLTTYGFDFQLIIAENNLLGLQIASGEYPDIIIIDFHAHDQKDINAIRLLKGNEETNKIPIIAMISQDHPDYQNIAFKHGVSECIAKPFSSHEFTARIIKAFELVDTNRQMEKKIFDEKDKAAAIENLHVISGHTPFAFIHIKPGGELEWANEGFERLHGCRIEEFCNNFGKTIFDLYPVPEMFALFEKCKWHRKSVDLTCQAVSKDRSAKWLQIFITPQVNHDNNIEKLIAIEVEITTFITKEEELQAQFEKLKEITQNLEQANALLEEQKKEINKQKQTIEEEQEKSEKLLLNILPFEIARQLKSKGRAGTRQYKLVSVLFADFKGFSNISKNLEPKDLVSILDSYFAKFDEITGKHYIEKIKTIGDAYMCAGGLPLSNKSNPIDTVLAGLEIQNYMNTLNDSKVLNNLLVWELRLGIHTGSVVAGVVGKKRFAYDIWGDAVNIASRMEQSGHVGMVNISGVTYEYVKDFFDCDYRGKIETKNLGKIDMYFVNRIKPEFSSDRYGILPNDIMVNLVNKL
jgi:class 3 adenylate cyclase/AmiR/NasT family two-component response regulator